MTARERDQHEGEQRDLLAAVLGAGRGRDDGRQGTPARGAAVVASAVRGGVIRGPPDRAAATYASVTYGRVAGYGSRRNPGGPDSLGTADPRWCNGSTQPFGGSESRFESWPGSSCTPSVRGARPDEPAPYDCRGRPRRRRGHADEVARDAQGAARSLRPQPARPRPAARPTPLGADAHLVVVGHGRDQVTAHLDDVAPYAIAVVPGAAERHRPRGTARARGRSAMPTTAPWSSLPGDAPLLTDRDPRPRWSPSTPRPARRRPC